jgi:hypothetical protein
MVTETISVKDCLQQICENHDGVLTAELVLREAKKKTSPLHTYFQWDDSEAAKQYRLIQAGDLIRRVKVTYSPREDVSYKVRAFFNVVSTEEGEESMNIYVPIKDALNTPSYREQLLAEAKRDSETFVKKYKVLNEVKDIINTIIAKDW